MGYFLRARTPAGKGKTRGKADFEFCIFDPASVGFLLSDADVAILFGFLIATLQKAIAYELHPDKPTVGAR
jgi:hypothetical protein